MRKKVLCKYNINRFFAVLFSLVLITGCGNKHREEDVIATVGNEKVTVEDFNVRLSNLPERYREVAKNRKKEFLDDIISDTLIYQKALEQSLDKDKDVIKVLEAAKMKIIIARFIKDNINDKIVITKDDILREYEDNKTAYMLPEMMRVKHILLRDRESAEEVIKMLAAGEKFEDVARAKSIDPTAQNGGDIGYFPKGQLMPEFEKACSALDKNETSGVVKTSLGYHVIKLIDRKEPVMMPLDKVEDKIKAVLVNKKRKEMFDKMMKDMRENTKIVINEDVLEKFFENSQNPKEE